MAGRRTKPAGDERNRPAPDAEAALEIAAHYLGARPRTRWELDRRLRRAGAEEPTIAATLQRLATLGHVDDLAFARWWLEQRDRHAPRGRRRVETELRQHGVPHEVILELRETDAADPGAEGEALPATEADRAQVALRRHLRGRELPSDTKAVQRVGAFLVRRGFDPDTVRATLRAAGRPDPEES
jgi:regulatory protein